METTRAIHPDNLQNTKVTRHTYGYNQGEPMGKKMTTAERQHKTRQGNNKLEI